MNRKTSPIAIGLLIVGLIIGAGGGYYYNSNSLNPIITQLGRDTQALTAEIDTKNTETTALETQLNGLQVTQVELVNEIANVNQEKTQTASAITNLNQTIKTHQRSISDLRSQEDAKEGYEVCSVYNLSFEYPEGMNFTISEVRDNTVSEKYGIITGAIANTTNEQITYIWQTVDFVPDMQIDLNSLILSYVNGLSAYPNIKTNIGPVKTTKVNGHNAYYQGVIIEDGEKTQVASYATWYCSEEEIAYRAFYYNILSSSLSNFEGYLLSTQCHR